MKTLITTIILLLTSSAYAGPTLESIIDFIAFWRDGYTIEYCNGEPIKKNEMKFKIDLKKDALSFAISDQKWKEQTKRSVSIFHAQDQIYLYDTIMPENKQCLVISGEDVSKKMNQIKSVSYDFNFNYRSLLQTEVSLGHERLVIDNKNLGELGDQLSSEARSLLNSTKLLNINPRDINFLDIDLKNKNTRFISLTMEYFKKSDLKKLTVDELTQKILDFNSLALKLEESLNFQTPTYDLSKDEDFRAINKLAREIKIGDGRRSHKSITQKALATLPFGTSTNILQNIIRLITKMYHLDLVDKLVTTDQSLDINQFQGNALAIAINFSSNLKPTFEPLCQEDFKVDLPFQGEISGNLADVFLTLINRSSSMINSNQYSSLNDFTTFIQDLSQKEITYAAAMEDEAIKTQLKDMYNTMVSENNGLPSLTLAQGELTRLNTTLKKINYPRLIKEYFVELSADIKLQEAALFKEVHNQLKSFQTKSDQKIQISPSSLESSRTINLRAQTLIKELNEKQVNLVELIDYLKTFTGKDLLYLQYLCTND